MKRILKVFFFILLGMMITYNVNAGSKITLKNDKMVTKNGWVVYQIKVDNNLAFCLEPGIITGTTSYKKQDYHKVYKKLSKSKKDKIKKIALFSEYLYNQDKKKSKNYYKYYYAGSELIWEVITGKKYRFKKDLTSYRNKITKEVNDFNKFSKIDKQIITLKPQQAYVDKSDYYQYISLDNVKEFEQQSQMKVNLTSKQLSIQNNNNTDNKTYTLNYQKYAKTFNKGTSYAYYNAYTQDYAVIKDDSKLKGYVKVNTMAEYGSFDGYKIDDKQNKLTGITFSYYQNNQKLGEVKTDQNGYFKSDKLLVGSYTLQEEANDKYLVNNKVYKIEIKPEEVFHVNDNKPIVNKLKPQTHLIIYKKDKDNDEPIAGTHFKIKGIDKVYITNKKGTIDIDLKNKCYDIEEVKPSPGYLLSKYPQKICLKKGETTLLTFTNRRKKLVKTGSDNLNWGYILGLSAVISITISEAFKKKD